MITNHNQNLSKTISFSTIAVKLQSVKTNKNGQKLTKKQNRKIYSPASFF